MYKVTVNWYENYCQIDEDSDFLGQLITLFPIQGKSEEEVEDLIYDRLDNLSYNHYGLFSQQTEVIHNYLI